MHTILRKYMSNELLCNTLSAATIHYQSQPT